MIVVLAALLATQVVVPGTPSAIELVGEPRAVLLGPVDVPADLTGTKDVIFVVLDGVTFAPDTGSSAEIYLVDASRKPPRFDDTNYLGSVGSMAGAPQAPIMHTVEINDFEVGAVKFRPRTKLRNMKSVYVALLVHSGTVKMQQVRITTKSPFEG